MYTHTHMSATKLKTNVPSESVFFDTRTYIRHTGQQAEEDCMLLLLQLKSGI